MATALSAKFVDDIIYILDLLDFIDILISMSSTPQSQRVSIGAVGETAVNVRIYSAV